MDIMVALGSENKLQRLLYQIYESEKELNLGISIQNKNRPHSRTGNINHFGVIPKSSNRLEK